MKAINLSSKHLKIDQANSTIMVVVAVASVITIFSLVSVKALLAQASHQRHVLTAKNIAVKQQKKNLETAKNLETPFAAFNQSNPNIIGGAADNNSTGIIDGDNARIALDALPSQYDFPALISSLEKILLKNGITTPLVTGTDLSNTLNSLATATPQPTTVTVTVGGVSSYQSAQNFIKDLEHSIRPFDVTNLELSGNETSMQMTLNVNTYYLQAKSLDNGSKEVK
jgi:hypothetical protein